jgi:hypothetical protein
MSPDGVDPRPADHAGTTTHVIDMGQQPIDSRRPLPWRVFAAVVLVVVAGVVGYVIGDHHGAAMTTARPLVSPTRVVEPLSTVSVTGRQCAVEFGHQLQLGIEITNDTRHTVSLKTIGVDVILPVQGLSVRAKQFGTCGLVGGNTGPQPLAPGNSTWISATFDNHQPCPVSSSSNIFTASIIYTVHYDDGLIATGGFSNLPDIAFPACALPSG